MGCLDSKVFLITGGGRGIGRATALFFAREGARLVVNDSGSAPDGTGSDPEIAAAVVREVRALGTEAVPDDEDITSPQAGDRLVARTLEHYGRIDGLVACAGIRRDRSLTKMPDEDLDRALDVHVRGSFALSRAVARALIDQRQGGSIVLSTAPAAFFGSARQSALAAAHAAVAAMTRSAAVELRKHGIRVNAVAPTAHTRLTADLPLFQRIGEASMSADHIAPVVAFLSSEMARDIFGEVLGVAGGRVYSFRCRETTGTFVEGRPFRPHEIRDAWAEITRG